MIQAGALQRVPCRRLRAQSIRFAFCPRWSWQSRTSITRALIVVLSGHVEGKGLSTSLSTLRRKFLVKTKMLTSVPACLCHFALLQVPPTTALIASLKPCLRLPSPSVLPSLAAVTPQLLHRKARPLPAWLRAMALPPPSLAASDSLYRHRLSYGVIQRRDRTDNVCLYALRPLFVGVEQRGVAANPWYMFCDWNKAPPAFSQGSCQQQRPKTTCT
jgi:hypothetical protein